MADQNPDRITEAIEAAREAISGSFDVIPEGHEPFAGWSNVLAERAVTAALPLLEGSDGPDYKALAEELYEALKRCEHPRSCRLWCTSSGCSCGLGAALSAYERATGDQSG
jgi:hypothetical protein